MEKRFHARWWDYSQKPMNLHGRIWIGNLILFGLGGVAVIHIVNPVLMNVFSYFPMTGKKIAAGVLLLIFAADYVLTHFMMKLVKVNVENSEADSTEALNREIQLLLSDRNVFYRRFADAYPDVIYRTERIKLRLDTIREETEEYAPMRNGICRTIGRKSSAERNRQRLSESASWRSRNV